MIPSGYKVVEYGTPIRYGRTACAEMLRAFGASLGAVDYYIGLGYVAYVVPA